MSLRVSNSPYGAPPLLGGHIELYEGDRLIGDSLGQAGADTVIDLDGHGRMILAGVQSTTLASGWIVHA